MEDEKMIGYHPVVWREPIIYEIANKGTRNDIIPRTEDEIKKTVGDVISRIPEKLRRIAAPNLPELTEQEVVRHYIRLSQQTLGVDSANQIGVGTCTMKYNPKFCDQLTRSSKVTDVHPLQDEETVQGCLELMYRLQDYLCEVAGMDEFSLQGRGGSHGVYANACIIRAYHKLNGELDQRDEIITSVISHPCDAGCPATAGFKIVTLYPDEETGCPDIEAFKAAVSKRTAGLMFTDPYDTGVFDANLEEYVKIIHEVGGLVACDLANANGVLGKIRVGDVGVDLCQFNLHKSFGAPHGSYGPASGPIGVKKELEKFLPVPVVVFKENKYSLDYDRPYSIGKIGGFYGNFPVVLKAYAWIRRMGAEGLIETAETAVINNNYLIQKLLEIRGVSMPYAKGHHRIQEARMSLQKMKEETGIGTEDVNRRIVDFGVQSYFESHHPWVVPEPFTPEPTEAVTKEDLDRWIEIFRQISNEAYTNPEIIKTAPHNAIIHKIDETTLTDPEKWAFTWRAFLKKRTCTR